MDALCAKANLTCTAGEAARQACCGCLLPFPSPPHLLPPLAARVTGRRPNPLCSAAVQPGRPPARSGQRHSGKQPERLWPSRKLTVRTATTPRKGGWVAQPQLLNCHCRLPAAPFAALVRIAHDTHTSSSPNLRPLGRTSPSPPCPSRPGERRWPTLCAPSTTKAVRGWGCFGRPCLAV